MQRSAVLGVVVVAVCARVDRTGASSPTLAPWIAADRGRLELRWDRTQTGHVTASAQLHGPELRIVRQHGDQRMSSAPREGVGKRVRHRTSIPISIGPVELYDGSLVFTDISEPTHVRLRLHDVQATVENFSTSRVDSHGLPMLLTARGRIGEDGRIVMFVTANPWTQSLNLSGRVQITGLRLTDIAGLVERKVDLRPTGGSISVFMQFTVHNGELRGGAKTFIVGADVAPADSGIFDQLRSWFATGLIELLEHDVGGRERLGTTIPLRGRLTDPHTSMWDALVGFIGNAFIDALEVGYSGLRPRAPG